VDALDVERPNPLVNERFKLVRERELLNVVFTLQEIERVGLA
jgi:hypothetical protein